MSIEAIPVVGADPVHFGLAQLQSTDAGHRTGAAMLSALASILRHGIYSAEEVKTLLAVADDDSVDFGTRCLARQSVEWLMAVDLNGTAAQSVIKQ